MWITRINTVLLNDHLNSIADALYEGQKVFWINEGDSIRIIEAKDDYLISRSGYLDINNVAPQDIFIGMSLED